MLLRHSWRTAAIILLTVAWPSQFRAGLQQKPSVSPTMEKWLDGADREDFGWTVRLSAPGLTYQQRYLVQVQATLSTDGLQTARQLIATVVVGDANGRWLQESRPTILDLPANLSRGREIRYVIGIYLRPGKYEVAVSVNAPAAGKRNLWRKQLRIPPTQGKPASNWDEHFPQVEFASDVPDLIVGRYPRQGKDSWPLAHPLSRVKVSNVRPVRIDLVLLGSKPRLEGFRGGRAAQPLPALIASPLGVAMQVGSLLSLLDLESGCVRASVVDPRQNRIFLDRQEAHSANWDQVQDEVWAPNQTVVDRGALENRMQPLRYLKDYLQAIVSDTGGCGASGQKMRRIVVLVGAGALLSSRTELEVLNLKIGEGCRLYYFQHQVGPPGRPLSDVAGDAVADLLRPVGTRVFKFADPLELGRALDLFLSELKQP